jgi:hypothetical protein
MGGKDFKPDPIRCAAQQMAHRPPGFAVSPNSTQRPSKMQTVSKKILDQAVGCVRRFDAASACTIPQTYQPEYPLRESIHRARTNVH